MAKITDFINGKVTYDKEGQYFLVTQPNGGTQMIGELHGWGRIKNMFVTKRPVFDMDSAAKFQDELGEFVASAINEKIERLK